LNKQPDLAKDQDSTPDLNRRYLGVGLVAVLGTGLGVTNMAQAFPPGSAGEFNAVSRILARYGVSVRGEFDQTVTPGHDVLTTRVVQQPVTEYRQEIGTLGRAGIIPCVKTSVFEGDASFIHFHPGEIVPCVRTTIERHVRATHELFDTDEGGIVPCVKVASEMLDGGLLGAVEVSVNVLDVDFSVRVGGKFYLLVEGSLVEQRPVS